MSYFIKKKVFIKYCSFTGKALINCNELSLAQTNQGWKICKIVKF